MFRVERIFYLDSSFTVILKLSFLNLKAEVGQLITIKACLQEFQKRYSSTDS